MKRVALSKFIVAAVLVSLGLAIFVSPHASQSPDGLTKVAAVHGIDRTERASRLADTPTAGYTVPGLQGGWATAAAGAIGVSIALGVMLLLVRVLIRPTRSAPRPA